MATASRPYIVTNSATKERRLIRAANQAQARNYVARSLFGVEAASGNDVIEMMDAGIKPETATADEKETE
jgi:hypothetical protein